MQTENRPKLYIDIDGVLLANESNLAEGAAEFIKYAADNFQVYWLTTHCMHGDPAMAVRNVNNATDEDLEPYLRKFKPTTWKIKKTMAIDFSKPFMWFDDDCFQGEKQDLIDNNAFDSWIQIELDNYPDQMKHELKMLKSIIVGEQE